MIRKATITDYGKDYGHGRYNFSSIGLNLGTNSFEELVSWVRGFEDNDDPQPALKEEK